MKKAANPIVIALLLIGVASCDRGGNLLIVADIKGPDSVIENTSVEYIIEASGDTGIEYSWLTNPVKIGKFSRNDTASVIFTASEVESDTSILIRLVVTSERDGPVIRSKEIMIMDSGETDDTEPEGPTENRPPTAFAYVEAPEVYIEEEVRFFDASTDPDGPDDLAKWEWDFSYDADISFQGESQEREPVHTYPTEGTYQVQLRVQDQGGLSDFLDEPLELAVIEYREVPTAHASADRELGKTGDVIQFRDESLPPSDSEITLWEWDFSYDESEGFVTELSERNPSRTYLDTGDYMIQLRVTASNEKTDMLDEPLAVEIRPWGKGYAWIPCDPDGIVEGKPAMDVYWVGADDRGYVYMVGTHVGLLDLDPGSTTEEVYSTDEQRFLIKFDPNGDYLWSTIWEPCSDTVESACVLGSGGIIIGGNYQTDSDLDPGPDVHAPSGQGIYALYMDSNGAYQYSITVQDISGSDDEGWWFTNYTMQDVVIDEGNDALILFFEDYTEEWHWYWDPFIWDWMPECTFYGDENRFLAYADHGRNNSISASGKALDPMEIGNIAFTDIGDMLYTGKHGSCLYMSRNLDFDSELWILQIGNSVLKALEVDARDRIYIGGYISGIADVDPSAAEFLLTPKGEQDSFLAVYDTIPSLLWAGSWGSGYSRQYIEGCWAIDVDDQGRTVAGGNYYDGADLDPGGTEAIFSAWGYTPDLYVSLLNEDGELLDLGTFHSFDACDIDYVIAGESNTSWAVGWMKSDMDLDPGPGVYMVTPVTGAYRSYFLYFFEW